MKLKLVLSNTEKLKNILSTLSGLRKYIILKFTPDQLQIVSFTVGEPQGFCKISPEIFDEYSVQSIRNVIAFQVDVDAFFKALKEAEKSKAESVYIRLQRQLANEVGNNQETRLNKRSATLAITYNQRFSNYTNGNITHKLPISLLSKELEQKLQEPSVDNIDLFLRLPDSKISIFKRIERFKTVRNVTINGDFDGNLKLQVFEDNFNVDLKVDEPLLVSKVEGKEEDGRTSFAVTVRLKDWKMGLRFCEVCENVVLILSHGLAVILHCYMDDTDEVELSYFINAVE